jgi:hypothetical protein
MEKSFAKLDITGEVSPAEAGSDVESKAGRDADTSLYHPMKQPHCHP